MTLVRLLVMNMQVVSARPERVFTSCCASLDAVDAAALHCSRVRAPAAAGHRVNGTCFDTPSPSRMAVRGDRTKSSNSIARGPTRNSA